MENANYTGIIAIFVYLCLFILLTKLRKKKAVEVEEPLSEVKEITRSVTPLDPNDEDALVASLIAAIECRNEYHRNVQIVSVREIG